ncbi:transcriptional regulator [Helicobacter didelphidarum]|uniref:Transcriptional regulator n=1 Tax=Helicobacter didelphidarum TaxID=2040648 RepID=A0A3D8IAS2_9HELI|nr:TfoX/Sxy family protein [Helicobacter didelphidarum]RDU62242.1 transcriptional regulator [Helicobacter didelphidarum]
MASSEEFKDFTLEQLRACGSVYRFSARKMFGEYCIYVHDFIESKKPIFLICNDILYVRKHEALREILSENECGFPYDGAKENYILDVENLEILESVITTLTPLLPIPKPKKRNSLKDKH